MPSLVDIKSGPSGTKFEQGESDIRHGNATRSTEKGVSGKEGPRQGGFGEAKVSSKACNEHIRSN